MFRREHAEAENPAHAWCDVAFADAAKAGGQIFVADHPLAGQHVLAHDQIRRAIEVDVAGLLRGNRRAERRDGDSHTEEQ